MPRAGEASFSPLVYIRKTSSPVDVLGPVYLGVHVCTPWEGPTWRVTKSSRRAQRPANPRPRLW